MSRAQVFPYPVAQGELQLSYTLQSDHLVTSESGHLSAEGVPDDAGIVVGLEVATDPDVLLELLPEAERANPPWAIVVAVRSVSARLRCACRLEGPGPVWRGTWTVDKRDLYGDVLLEPILVRIREGQSKSHASHVGAVLATGDPLYVDVDEPSLPNGGFIDIRFEDFRTSPVPRRRESPGLFYALDTEQDSPTLWLNEAIDELKTVMLAKGPRGYNLRVRDAMFDTIVSQVWTSLLATAFTGLALVVQENRDPDDELDPIELLPEWQQRTLHFWAPKLFEQPGPEAIEMLREIASDRARTGEVYERVTTAVQQWANTPAAFKGLLRLRDRDGV